MLLRIEGMEISLFVSPELWNMRLPRDMVTSSTRSPLFIAFIASQIYFQYHILFRNIPLSKYFIDMKDKIHSGEKSEMDLHHIFPRNYLIFLYGKDAIEAIEYLSKNGTLILLSSLAMQCWLKPINY